VWKLFDPTIDFNHLYVVVLIHSNGVLEDISLASTILEDKIDLVVRILGIVLGLVFAGHQII